MIYLCSRVLTCLQQREVADLHSLAFMHRGGARRLLYLMSKQQSRDENDEREAPVSVGASLCSRLNSKAPRKTWWSEKNKNASQTDVKNQQSERLIPLPINNILLFSEVHKSTNTTFLFPTKSINMMYKNWIFAWVRLFERTMMEKNGMLAW